MSKWTALVMLVAMAGCTGAEKPYATYEDKAKMVRVTVTTQQRMPDMLGGEEIVLARVAHDGREYGPYTIDINGRFGESLHADISTDRQWVRFYEKLSRPLKGLRTTRMVNGEMSDLGATVAGADVREYRYSTIAYVCTKTNRLYRFAYKYSTPEMRDQHYFGLQEEMKPTQQFEDTRVTWEPATRDLQYRHGK